MHGRPSVDPSHTLQTRTHWDTETHTSIHAETHTLNNEKNCGPNPVIGAWQHACQLQNMALAVGLLIDARAWLHRKQA